MCLAVQLEAKQAEYLRIQKNLVLDCHETTVIFLQLQLMTLELETGYTKSSIKRLESRFKSLDKDHKGWLERRDLMTIPEVHGSYLFSRGAVAQSVECPSKVLVRCNSTDMSSNPGAAG